jgi:myosin heavy subunit
MPEWSEDLTPEPQATPPPQLDDYEESEIFWEDADATFASDSSLGRQVHAHLNKSVPTFISPDWGRPGVPQQPQRYRGASPITHDRMKHELQETQNQLKQARNKILEMTGLVEHSSCPEVGKLEKTIEVLSATNTRLAEEKRAIEKRVAAHEDAHSLLEKALEESNLKSKQLEQVLEKCRADLKITQDLEERKGRELEEVQAKHKLTEAKLAETLSDKRRTVSELSKSNHELNSRVQSLQQENQQLKKLSEESTVALDAKCQECLELMQERTVLRRRLEKPRQCDAAVQTNEAFTSDRLTRIRQASERTGILRQHQEEVARLVEKHESQLSEMESRHLERLAEVQEQAIQEGATQAQQYQQNQTKQHQRRLEEMEDKHRADTKRMKEEYERKLAATTDSLELALEHVADVTEQLEEESRTRQNLDSRLEEMCNEKTRLCEQHQAEIESLKVAWESERAALLTDIQRGCDRVITEHRRVLSPSLTLPSPRNQLDFDMQQDSPSLRRLSPSSKGANNSTVCQSLAETEALVMQVLGDGCMN